MAANITPTNTGASQEGDLDGIVVFTWTPVASGDTCLPATGFSAFADRAIQVTGTFGASTPSVAIQGTLDGTNYAALRDPQGTTIAITAAGIKQIQENVRGLKPVFTGGDGTSSLTITVLARRR